MAALVTILFFIGVTQPLSDALVIRPQTGSLFMSHGYLIGGLSWSHIILELDLDLVHQDIKKHHVILQHLDEVANMKHPSSKRIQVTKRIAEEKIDTMQNDLNEVIQGFHLREVAPRQKRQVVVGIAAIGGLLVGALASSLFSQFRATTLVDILEKRVTTITAQVDQNALRILQTEEDLKRINTTVAAIVDGIGKLILADKELDSYALSEFTLQLINNQFNRVERLCDALDHLLQGKLHRGLVNSTGLQAALERVKREANTHGYLIGAQHLTELYQLPTSFLLDPASQKLSVLVHIPMYKDSHILSLYKYFPLPLPMNHSLFITLHPNKQYLARNRDGTLTRILNEEQLDDCLSIGHAYFCDDHALEKPKRPSCLVQLFKGLENGMVTDCESQLHSWVSIIERINRTSYAIAESTPFTVTVECLTKGAVTQTHRFQPGTYVMHVDTNCTTTSDNWVISPTLTLSDVSLTVTWVPHEMPTTAFLSDVPDLDIKVIQATLAKVGQPIPLSQLHQLAAFRKAIEDNVHLYKTAHIWLSPTVALIVLGIIGVGIYCVCRRHRCFPRIECVHEKRQQTEEPYVTYARDDEQPFIRSRTHQTSATPETTTATTTAATTPRVTAAPRVIRMPAMFDRPAITTVEQ
jgi:hypothetical protein